MTIYQLNLSEISTVESECYDKKLSDVDICIQDSNSLSIHKTETEGKSLRRNISMTNLSFLSNQTASKSAEKFTDYRREQIHRLNNSPCKYKSLSAQDLDDEITKILPFIDQHIDEIDK